MPSTQKGTDQATDEVTPQKAQAKTSEPPGSKLQYCSHNLLIEWQCRQFMEQGNSQNMEGTTTTAVGCWTMVVDQSAVDSLAVDSMCMLLWLRQVAVPWVEHKLLQWARNMVMIVHPCCFFLFCWCILIWSKTMSLNHSAKRYVFIFLILLLCWLKTKINQLLCSIGCTCHTDVLQTSVQWDCTRGKVN